MSSRAGKLSRQIFLNNRRRAAGIIMELYQIVQSQPLHKRIAFALRVVFKRLPK